MTEIRSVEVHTMIKTVENVTNPSACACDCFGCNERILPGEPVHFAFGQRPFCKTCVGRAVAELNQEQARQYI